MPRRNRRIPPAHEAGRLIRLEDDLHRTTERRQETRRQREAEAQTQNRFNRLRTQLIGQTNA